MSTASVIAAEQVGAPALACRPALTAAALADHHAIRHEVFLREQSVFVGSDLDEHDRAERSIRLVGYYHGVAAGSVRLFELGSGIWQGDRLAVLAPYRVHGVGAPLVRCAVATAACKKAALTI